MSRRALFTLAAIGACVFALATYLTAPGDHPARAAVRPAVRTSRPGRALRAVEVAAAASCPPAIQGLGTLALTSRRGLEVLDLARCSLTTVAGPGAQTVSFSPSGRWLAYSTAPVYAGPGAPIVVPVGGGRPRRPFGSDVVAWTWARNADILYGVTGHGTILSAPAAGGPRRTVARLGATVYQGLPVTLSPDGRRLAVDLSSCDRPDPMQPLGRLDVVDLRNGRQTVTLEQTGAYLTLAGFSPDGHWLLYWRAGMCSASLAADGWPLYAVRAAGGTPVRVVPSMLLYDDFLSWCGERLIAAAGPDRETEVGSRLVRSGPPGWHRQTVRRAGRLSWVSPACSPSGTSLVAAAGPGHEVRFGRERRSIWLLTPTGHILARLDGPPPPGSSDEAPRFSADGRWVLFVRARVVSDGSQDTLEMVPADGSAPAIQILGFASDDLSFFDHFGFATEIAWHPPSPPSQALAACRSGRLSLREVHLPACGGIEVTPVVPTWALEQGGSTRP